MERYRSGHNEAVLKTVCPKGRVGSNPTLSARTSGTDPRKEDLSRDVRNHQILIHHGQRELSDVQFGEVPKLAEGTPLERVQVVKAARGFKSLLLRLIILSERQVRTEKQLEKPVDKHESM
jgi:hypothetical protein